MYFQKHWKLLFKHTYQTSPYVLNREEKEGVGGISRNAFKTFDECKNNLHEEFKSVNLRKKIQNNQHDQTKRLLQLNLLDQLPSDHR